MTPLQVHSIHIAVLQKDLPRVRKLLHRKPTHVNLQDSKGATPLMLAALVGYPKLVTFLLEKRASWRMTDRRGYSASAYVRGPVAEQMRLRYRRLMRAPVSKSPKQRRDIFEHLSDHTGLKTQYRTETAGTLSFRRHGGSLSIFKLIAKVQVAGTLSQNTTAACIAAGNSIKPLMCAVSGWRTTTSPGVLDGEKYTQIVRDMATILDFDLPKHCYDTPGGGSFQENVGRFFAVRMSSGRENLETLD